MRRAIQIAPAWRINHDALQWILEHRRGNRWHGVSFVESDKRTLRRVLREKRIIHDATNPTPWTP